MAGLQFPTEVINNLSWNRLIKETYTAVEVPDSYGDITKTQILPVPIQGNGYIYLIGCDVPNAPPSWRLGCSVRLAESGNPDSTGIFTDPNGFPVRIEDRKICTIGAYSLHIWPNLELPNPWLILHFPHWIDEITVEIFWYDGATTVSFFEQVRDAVLELYQDPDFVPSLNMASVENVEDLLATHLGDANPHSQYLLASDAVTLYEPIGSAQSAIASHVTDQVNPHQISPEMIGAATPSDVQSAINAHLAEVNPHEITVEDITSRQTVTLSLQNPWSNAFGRAALVHKQNKLVILSGVIGTQVTLSNDTVIASLPVGFRPPHVMFLVTWAFFTRENQSQLGNDGIMILPSGEIYGSNSDEPTIYHYVSLDGCCFYVD